jgi:uncharacterized membrane protein YesL
MKSNLFDPESWLWKPFGRIADFILLSALWLLCSLPLVTAGPAFCAMYDCCARCVLGKEGGMTARFFRTFRRELGLGIGSLLLWGAVLGLGLGILRTFTSNATGTDANVILAWGMAFLLALLVGVAAWVFPLLSRFTFRFTDLQLMSVRLALGHLPRTVAVAAVTVASGWLCLRFLLPVIIVPGLGCFLIAHLLEPVFKTYETGNAGEDNG